MGAMSSFSRCLLTCESYCLPYVCPGVGAVTTLGHPCLLRPAQTSPALPGTPATQQPAHTVPARSLEPHSSRGGRTVWG